MYYKLRCNSTQFVIYYKLRNYYKLQRNTAPWKMKEFFLHPTIIGLLGKIRPDMVPGLGLAKSCIKVSLNHKPNISFWCKYK